MKDSHGLPRAWLLYPVILHLRKPLSHLKHVSVANIFLIGVRPHVHFSLSVLGHHLAWTCADFCHQRLFVLGKEHMGRVEGRIEWLRGNRDFTIRPMKSTHLDPRRKCSQRLNHQPNNIHGLELGLLLTCNRSTAWSSCNSSNNWSRCCPWLCCLFEAALSGLSGRGCT